MPADDYADDLAEGWDEVRARAAPPFSLPRQWLAHLASCFAMAGTAIALCARESGAAPRGQVVDAALVRCGLWFAQQDHLFLRPENASSARYQQLMRRSPLTFQRATPPTMNFCRTSDGIYIQCLDLDWLPHLSKWLGALRVRHRAYPALACALLTKLIPQVPALRAAGPGALPMVAMALCPSLNAPVRRRVREMTWKQLAALFAKEDLWYTRIHTPAQALRYRHAEQCGSFAQLRAADRGSGREMRTVAPPCILNGLQWQVFPPAVDARADGERPWLRRLVAAMHTASGNADEVHDVVRERHSSARLVPVRMGMVAGAQAPVVIAPAAAMATSSTGTSLLARPRL